MSDETKSVWIDGGSTINVKSKDKFKFDIQEISKEEALEKVLEHVEEALAYLFLAGIH